MYRVQIETAKSSHLQGSSLSPYTIGESAEKEKEEAL